MVVKRAPTDLVERMHASGVPIVHDIVDAWTQPMGNNWDQKAAMTWLRGQVRRIRPCALVAATEQMAVDCAEFGLPVIALSHHARPCQELNPIRERVHVVGYEGGENYLGKWHGILKNHCAARGWRFAVNEGPLSDMDIVVALREADGYPARHWKSGVKLANAQATGTPCILSPERGYLETQSGAECWAENEQGLAQSFTRLEQYRARADASRILRSAAPHLPSIAGRYRSWLDGLTF